MISFKKLFIFSLLVSLLIVEVHAGPKRIFSGESKNKDSSLTSEGQTRHNRAAAEKRESGEEDDEERRSNFDKIARRERMADIPEGSSLAALEVKESSSASSSQPINPTAPIRFLRTQDIPSLYRFTLEKLMSLSPEHAVFRNGLPQVLYIELIDPYFRAMTEIIQDTHKACQRYSLYLLPPDEKEKNIFIGLKNSLQKQREICQRKLFKRTERDYPQALFVMDAVMRELPKITSSIECLKKQRAYIQQATLARNSAQLAHASLLDSAAAPLEQQASLLMKIAKMNITLQGKLLKGRSDHEIESSQKTMMDLEAKLARMIPVIESQKIFSGRLEELTQDQKTRIQASLQSSFKILNALSATPVEGNEETVLLLQQAQNAHDQIVKALLSTDPRIQRIQENIVKGNGKVASIASMIMNAKREQRRMAFVREGRLIDCPNGQSEAKGEGYAPIFELYQIPSSFLDKEIALLKKVEADFLGGREELAFQKSRLATGWLNLATQTAEGINMFIQLGMIISPEELLNQVQVATRDALISEEGQLTAQAGFLGINRDLASLSLQWDFHKTFEENVAAF